jgi:uncharacterized protein YndB with AHSA1/START domain
VVGPRGFTNTFHEYDPRPGGVWRFVMHGPDGTDYGDRVIFREVVDSVRLVYDHGDDSGESSMFRSTVTFEDEGGKTRVTMRAIFPTAQDRQFAVEQFGAIEGGNQTLERLAEHLTKM